jgi:hypothetical protein
MICAAPLSKILAAAVDLAIAKGRGVTIKASSTKNFFQF